MQSNPLPARLMFSCWCLRRSSLLNLDQSNSKLEVGSVHPKNTKAVLIKNIGDASLGWDLSFHIIYSMVCNPPVTISVGRGHVMFPPVFSPYERAFLVLVEKNARKSAECHPRGTRTLDIWFCLSTTGTQEDTSIYQILMIFLKGLGLILLGWIYRSV